MRPGLRTAHGTDRDLETNRATARVIEVTKNMSVVLYVAVLIAVVVSVDMLSFKDRFSERPMVNVGFVLVLAQSNTNRPVGEAAADGRPSDLRAARQTIGSYISPGNRSHAASTSIA
jgi:hypothetical protein